MRSIAFYSSVITVSFSLPAIAHPGHMIEVAGHNHWLAGVAIGAAIGIALWGFAKGKKQDPEAEKESAEEINEEPQEA